MMQLRHLPPHARLWLFLSDTALSAAQQEDLNIQLTAFTATWKSHGNSLSAGFDIQHSQLIVIAVDQQAEAPSGCSIDKAFRLLQDFGFAHKIDFFNRLLVPVETADGLLVVHRSALPAMISNGQLSLEQSYYDLTITRLDALETSFKKPLNQGWVMNIINI